MLGIYKGFIITLVVFNFFSICCESIVCGKNYKSIYNFFTGLIVITIVIAFIFRIKGVSVTDILNSEYNNSILDEVRVQIDKKIEDINEEAIESYKKIIGKNIENYVYEQGYNAKYIDVTVENEKISSIALRIEHYKKALQKSEKDINEIEEVCIGIDNYGYDDEPVLIKMKNELSAVYELETEKIYIYLEEE